MTHYKVERVECIFCQTFNVLFMLFLAGLFILIISAMTYTADIKMGHAIEISAKAKTIRGKDQDILGSQLIF